MSIWVYRGADTEHNGHEVSAVDPVFDGVIVKCIDDSTPLYANTADLIPEWDVISGDGEGYYGGTVTLEADSEEDARVKFAELFPDEWKGINVIVRHGGTYAKSEDNEL